MLSGLMSNETIYVKPTAIPPRQDSITTACPPDPHSPPVLNGEQAQDQGQKLIEMEDQEELPDCFEDQPHDEDIQQSRRPLSTVAPLPADFSVRRAAPDLAFSNRYMAQFQTIPDSSYHHPKRFSSLGYSRNLPQFQPAQKTSTSPSPSRHNMRRPTSMQLRREPMTSTTMQGHQSSECLLGEEKNPSGVRIREADPSARLSIQRPPKGVRSSFGPPAGPPPNCPLPAVPMGAQPFRRPCSLARETVWSRNWG